MANPWDIPPLSSPDENIDVLYASVGRSLSAWEGLEHHLATFFAFFVAGNSDNDLAARRAYGSIISFSARADVLANAARGWFANDAEPHEDLEEKFANLLDLARRFSARRNEIAHGIASQVFLGDPAVMRFDQLKTAWWLEPSEYSSNKNRLETNPKAKGRWSLTPHYRYSSKEINALGSQFQSLEKRAFDLMMYWGKQRPREWPAPPL